MEERELKHQAWKSIGWLVDVFTLKMVKQSTQKPSS
jgi:hypothetical protein